MTNHSKSIQFCVIVFTLTLFFFKLEASNQPNLVFIIADDCTFRDIGCYGGQAYTPNIDNLATQGMKFNKCFQTAPMCSPTRHTIYTGLYPVKSGAFPNHTFIKDDVKTIIHYLKPLGYRVALSGKSHVGPAERFPFEKSKHNTKKDKLASVIDFKSVENLMKDCSESNTPFALFACSNEPHTPWNKGVEYREKYDPDKLKLRPYMVDTPETRIEYCNYLAEISFFDSEVGRVLSLLNQYELSDNTLVMVVSEQGNNFPFAKWSCYDSGLQSIMVVRWPEHVQPGSETDAMVEYVDICPTFVEAAGGTIPESIDGNSFISVLKGKTNQHKQYVFGLQTSRGIFRGPHHYPIRSIRGVRYKLILNLDPEAKFFNTINRKPWFKNWEEVAQQGNKHAQKMINRFSSRPAVELYDLQSDPFEMKNLAKDSAQSDNLEKLKMKLQEWMAFQGDKGLETELMAFERMSGGNAEYKKWLEEKNDLNRSKKN